MVFHVHTLGCQAHAMLPCHARTCSQTWTPKSKLNMKNRRGRLTFSQVPERQVVQLISPKLPLD